jgi:hypothetical protein
MRDLKQSVAHTVLPIPVASDSYPVPEAPPNSPGGCSCRGFFESVLEAECCEADYELRTFQRLKFLDARVQR